MTMVTLKRKVFTSDNRAQNFVYRRLKCQNSGHAYNLLGITGHERYLHAVHNLQFQQI